MQSKIVLNKKVEKVACELRDELKKSLKEFKGLYVYGSQARGNYNKYSDIDIVVIIDTKNVWDKKNDIIWNKANLLGYKHNVFIDLQPYTRKELERNYIYCCEVVDKGVFYN
ncbi:MAG: nucleotidyltransferase domain-containing protein [Elusimicrobiota bacterium]|jgi:predicted nucleotidyltransferase|nr:nucleotidyltransferase domain-containing protein [Elusimicrobiota bacterium]